MTNPPQPLLYGSREDLRPSKFALVVGNARSGTTLLGAIIDAHPRMMCANETKASSQFWRGLSNDEIIDELIRNVEDNHMRRRPSLPYYYGIETAPKPFADVDVIADKPWNPSLLLLHGDNQLIHALEQRLSCQLVLVHAVRDPFNAIATMHDRSGASLLNRARWYFMHCQAAQALIEQRGAITSTFHHEDMLTQPADEIARLYALLGHRVPAGLIDRVRELLFEQATQPRQQLDWPADVSQYIERELMSFAFLDRYRSH